MVNVYQSKDDCNTCKGDKIQTYINKPGCNCIPRIRNVTRFSDKIYNNSHAYLQSRVKLYDQQLSIQKKPDNKYLELNPEQIYEAIPPTNSKLGSQAFNSIYLSDLSHCSLVTVIYKPTNNEFFKQGSVGGNEYINNLNIKRINNKISVQNTWGINNVAETKFNKIICRRKIWKSYCLFLY